MGNLTKKLKNVFSLNTFIFVLLVFYVAVFWILVAWGLMTSFKSYDDFRINIFGLPKVLVWNYTFIFKMFKYKVDVVGGGSEYVGMMTMTFNSLVYSIGCSLSSALTPMVVGVDDTNSIYVYDADLAQRVKLGTKLIIIRR